MASMRMLKDKYYARIRTWDGIKQNEDLIPLKTSNRIEALERLIVVNKKEKDLKNGINFLFSWMNDDNKESVVRYTISKAISEYLKSRKNDGLRGGTLEIYERALDKFEKICGKNLPIENTTSNNIEMFKKLFSTNSKEYLNINLRALRTFYNWLYDKELIETLPKLKTVKIPNKLPTYFNEYEWQSIINLDVNKIKTKNKNQVIPNLEHYKRVWMFYYKTGCRLSEPFYGRLDGNWLIVDTDKSKTNTIREIELSDDLINIYYELIDKMNEHLKKYTSKKDFIKRYSRVFKQCCRYVRINDKHFHHIRHTFAIRRYLELRDIYEVMKELGHSSVTTTEIYTKFNLRRLEQDFPSLMKIDKTIQNVTKKVIRDTEFRDTAYLNNEIARG